MSQDVYNEITRLKDFYFKEEKINKHPTESEIESHLVTPLLVSMGWPREYISFERYCGVGTRADICLHDAIDRRENNNVIGVIEVKKHIKYKNDQDFMSARDQVARYIENFKNLKFRITTDGYSYHFYDDSMSLINKIELSQKNYEDFFKILSFKHSRLAVRFRR